MDNIPSDLTFVDVEVAPHWPPLDDNPSDPTFDDFPVGPAAALSPTLSSLTAEKNPPITSGGKVQNAKITLSASANPFRGNTHVGVPAMNNIGNKSVRPPVSLRGPTVAMIPSPDATIPGQKIHRPSSSCQRGKDTQPSYKYKRGLRLRKHCSPSRRRFLANRLPPHFMYGGFPVAPGLGSIPSVSYERSLSTSHPQPSSGLSNIGPTEIAVLLQPTIKSAIAKVGVVLAARLEERLPANIVAPQSTAADASLVAELSKNLTSALERITRLESEKVALSAVLSKLQSQRKQDSSRIQLLSSTGRKTVRSVQKLSRQVASLESHRQTAAVIPPRRRPNKAPAPTVTPVTQTTTQSNSIRGTTPVGVPTFDKTGSIPRSRPQPPRTSKVPPAPSFVPVGIVSKDKDMRRSTSGVVPSLPPYTTVPKYGPPAVAPLSSPVPRDRTLHLELPPSSWHPDWYFPDFVADTRRTVDRPVITVPQFPREPFRHVYPAYPGKYFQNVLQAAHYIVPRDRPLPANKGCNITAYVNAWMEWVYLEL